MDAFEGVNLDGVGGFKAVYECLIRAIVPTFVLEDSFGFVVVDCHDGVAGCFRFLDAWRVFGSFDDLKETMDSEGCFGLDLPDEVLVWLEGLQVTVFSFLYVDILFVDSAMIGRLCLFVCLAV